MWNIKKAELTETESRMLVVTRGWRWGKWGDFSKRVQTSSKMNKFWGSNVQHDYC